jgi:hypothetical protein
MHADGQVAAGDFRRYLKPFEAGHLDFLPQKLGVIAHGKLLCVSRISTFSMVRS